MARRPHTKQEKRFLAKHGESVERMAIGCKPNPEHHLTALQVMERISFTLKKMGIFHVCDPYPLMPEEDGGICFIRAYATPEDIARLPYENAKLHQSEGRVN